MARICRYPNRNERHQGFRHLGPSMAGSASATTSARGLNLLLVAGSYFRNREDTESAGTPWGGR
jgi:hypothetical protein